jgi:pimeloyl-ACP methyl ester carboxylesterase
VIVAFRGTYSIANTIADLSTIPQEYIPYPGDDDDNDDSESNGDQSGTTISTLKRMFSQLWSSSNEPPTTKPPRCDNCTVHSGFYTSWKNTKDIILPELTEALNQYPDYTLTLVGHSLGGAVAALASLDFKARGWNPKVTTFGEPRVGNEALNRYIDMRFGLPSSGSVAVNSTFRRITHASDPVPLLPLEEWGYHMHAGEIFISKRSLPPTVDDLRHCVGDEDRHCIAGSDDMDATDALRDQTPTAAPADLWEFFSNHRTLPPDHSVQMDDPWTNGSSDARWWEASRYKLWPIPARYKLWELFFAHRDYFWRIGLCIPGGDPADWYRKYPHQGDGREEL